jgi:hypothetical protein
MTFIFSKLPQDIINYILCFNPQFIIRKGKLSSIFLQNDERYKILEYITIKPVENPKHFFSYLGSSYISNERYDYEFNKQYNGIDIGLGRKNQFIDNDSLNICITTLNNNSIKYDISIYKLKPKAQSYINNFNKLRFYKGNMTDCNWNFIYYQYIRT